MIRRVRPIWPCPDNVRAFTTTRAGGVSRGPWASFNLGDACGDETSSVTENRDRFRLPLPGEPGWLRQVHGARVIRRESIGARAPEADAVTCTTPGLPCTVLTADCVPVLFCDRAGSRVAAAHAGWRGLAAGVLQATVAALDADPAELQAWLGPAISVDAYEVGEDLRRALREVYPDADEAFRADGGKLHLDLYAIARQALAAMGVDRVYGGGYCTWSDPDRFYSHRRDGPTGRMATVIWITQAAAEPAAEEDGEAPSDSTGETPGDMNAEMPGETPGGGATDPT